MKMSNLLRKRRRGISPVVSTIIMSAVVLTIGGALWSFAQSAATVIANDYIDSVLSLRDDAAERFTVEFVTNNSDCTELTVWVYNYGDVNVTADGYAFIGNYTYSTNENTPFIVASGEIVIVKIDVVGEKGDEITIKIHSRRQNNAYSTYIVP